ncbi:hypothetical protein C1646_776532 [Rhizophagus diaphanus]|nr:hypothetical protein C1646_776532 [Rhizophagus diaphanus] [Rhizophagus sp. MUCL 43196]
MACSKVLLGNFPELTEDFIQYFRDDISTLHSCILVNKFWCQITIPLLWKDPFSKKNLKNFHFIEIYLQKINEKDKRIFLLLIKVFIENEVKLNTFEIEISYKLPYE